MVFEVFSCFFFFQAEDGIRDLTVTGVQTCALPISAAPSGNWMSAGKFTTAWGQPHVANLPTEEVFTSPDRRRTEGTIRSTRPLAVGGRVIKGLELTFKDGGIT